MLSPGLLSRTHIGGVMWRISSEYNPPRTSTVVESSHNPLGSCLDSCQSSMARKLPGGQQVTTGVKPSGSSDDEEGKGVNRRVKREITKLCMIADHWSVPFIYPGQAALPRVFLLALKINWPHSISIAVVDIQVGLASLLRCKVRESSLVARLKGKYLFCSWCKRPLKNWLSSKTMFSGILLLGHRTGVPLFNVHRHWLLLQRSN